MQEYNINKVDQKKFVISLFDMLRGNEMPVFLCVGSDKFVSDSLAPIVSELLTKKYNIPAYVYGGLDYNINATNLTQAINYIETMHPHNPIVLIDATLGENVGKVLLSKGGFCGLGKLLPLKKIGDISILGVVGKNHKNFDLNSTRLSLVVSQARFISQAVAFVTKTLFAEKNKRLCELDKISCNWFALESTDTYKFCQNSSCTGTKVMKKIVDLIHQNLLNLAIWLKFVVNTFGLWYYIFAKFKIKLNWLIVCKSFWLICLN